MCIFIRTILHQFSQINLYKWISNYLPNDCMAQVKELENFNQVKVHGPCGPTEKRMSMMMDMEVRVPMVCIHSSQCKPRMLEIIQVFTLEIQMLNHLSLGSMIQPRAQLFATLQLVGNQKSSSSYMDLLNTSSSSIIQLLELPNYHLFGLQDGTRLLLLMRLKKLQKI